MFSRDSIPANRDHIPTYEKVKNWSHLRFLKYKLAPELQCPVGLIIGYDNVNVLAPLFTTPALNFGPYGQLTSVGWGVVGCTESVSYCKGNQVSYCAFSDCGVPADHNSAFCFKTSVNHEFTPWDMGQILEQDFTHSKNEDEVAHSLEDLRFLRILEKGIEEPNGVNYSMPLPFKSCDKPVVPNNRVTALNRLDKLRNRFLKDVQYFEKYSACIDKLLENEHAERVPLSDLNMTNTVWFLPHHGVFHPRKPDKLRVVFDSSAKFQGTCLNDLLLKGPDLTNSLIGVLLRFRREKVALSCDIEQMFYNFQVSLGFRDYLRFLWFDNNDLSKQPSVYRMNTHAFGLTSSPSCANFAMKQLVKDHRTACNEEAAEFLTKGYYVDDGVISLSSDEEVTDLIDKSVSLCKRGGLTLHKFKSNCETVMKHVNKNHEQDADKELPGPSIERLLGAVWCIESDSLQFRIIVDKKPLTRRGILSTVSSIYDPMGFVGPFILEGKLILQNMCQSKADWDDLLSEELLPRWEHWLKCLPDLEMIALNRCIKTELPIKRAELHHFSDASNLGYGQCSYLKVIDTKDNVKCSLIMAKSRVSPMKMVTIPRLELTAAVVSCQISNLLNRELCMEVYNYFWTDSQIVLSYLQNETRRFHVFVANRIQQIRNNTDIDQWNYVPTDINPADYASRGLQIDSLDDVNNCKWFQGPDFLHEVPVPDFKVQVASISNGDPEVKATCFHAVVNNNDLLDRLSYFSSWYRAKRALANCAKIIEHWHNKTVNKKTCVFSTCSVSDMRKAESTIIKAVQSSCFKDELDSLLSDTSVSSTSSLHKLCPFVDGNGIIRVGGRLTESSDLNYGEKHPIILPSAKSCHISKIVIMHFHAVCMHQGRGITVHCIRMNGFWIISLVSSTASVLYKCVKCRKLYKQTMEQQMSDLPADRVEEAAPFTYSAVDCFGPYVVKSGRKTVKRYAVLFTCLSCRAVHIEVANSLTTDSFINAYRRFVCIRGKVDRLRSDCGTNFIGAERALRFELDAIDDEKVRSQLRKDSCEYIFNVPSASHAGGVWERQIKSVRRVMCSLLSTVGTQLDEECLHTFLCEAAAIINSRPLSVDNLADPVNFMPISPSNLITGKPSIVMSPPGNFTNDDLYSSRRWKRTQFVVNQFWLKYRVEILQNLQLRKKWCKPCTNLKEGDIVLLKDDNAPRCDWHVCKVRSVYKGTDGRVRSAKLLIGRRDGSSARSVTTLDRPIQKMVFLLGADQ